MNETRVIGESRTSLTCWRNALVDRTVSNRNRHTKLLGDSTHWSFQSWKSERSERQEKKREKKR